jgi:hypothetical protein
MAGGGGRRRRGQRLRHHLAILAVIYGVGYLLLGPRIGLPALLLIDTTVLGLWVLLVMPTQCDYVTQRGGHCSRSVHGKLGACDSHGKLKRDAIFGAMGFRNPGTAYRVRWGDGTSQLGWTVSSRMPPRPDAPHAGAGSSGSAGGHQPGARYHRWMMIFTAVSALAAAAALVPK